MKAAEKLLSRIIQRDDLNVTVDRRVRFRELGHCFRGPTGYWRERVNNMQKLHAERVNELETGSV
jgi:hypothetical protein